MAAKQKTLLPPSPEVREQVLAAIRASAVPLTPRELKALLVPPYQAAEREIASILEDSVAAGMLRTVPATGAKRKPRYWARDPREVSRGLALEFVKGAE